MSEHIYTVFEFGLIGPSEGARTPDSAILRIPPKAYKRLDDLSLRESDVGRAQWLRPTQLKGERLVQVTSYAGVIYLTEQVQIEVLPKIGKHVDIASARRTLIDMLLCLREFRHLNACSANLAAMRLPLPEIFISEFLRAVESVIKHGLRRDYTTREGQLFNLRGKLKIASHLRENLVRRDRFYTEHDEFTEDRPVNRLIKTALMRVLKLTKLRSNQQRCREFAFAFADVPCAADVASDFRQLRLDRGMDYYQPALAWAELILKALSPQTTSGSHHAPSLLYPMEALFEAFVAKHLQRQLQGRTSLQTQVSQHALVHHREQRWFRLKPDLLVRAGKQTLLVLDTKWKLLDQQKASGSEKYGIPQTDMYQLYAYGQSYLRGSGDVVLIYPRTERFHQPLPVFDFPHAEALRLWVVPFCLQRKRIETPPALCAYFSDAHL